MSNALPFPTRDHEPNTQQANLDMFGSIGIEGERQSLIREAIDGGLDNRGFVELIVSRTQFIGKLGAWVVETGLDEYEESRHVLKIADWYQGIIDQVAKTSGEYVIKHTSLTN